MEGQAAFAFLALLVRLEQVGQRPAKQRVRVDPQQFADRGRDIDQRPAPIGFPEPALAGLLEIVEDFLGAQLGAGALAVAARFGCVGFGLTHGNVHAAGRADRHGEQGPAGAAGQGNPGPQRNLRNYDHRHPSVEDDRGD